MVGLGLGLWSVAVNSHTSELLLSVVLIWLLTNDVGVSLVGIGGLRGSVHTEQVLFQIKNGFFEITNERPRLYVASC